MATTTKHTCGGPIFGRKTAGCPRCDELLAGAAPVRWGSGLTCRYCGGRVERGYLARVCGSCQIRRHDCTASHCSIVCTFGDS